MAVHGTRRRESVSWDYPGLLQLLGNLAMERTNLPLLRCYWYEATVEGRRSADHDTLADLPGVKLRVAKMRPGRREGVEGEIHRDLTTLARNKAVSDAMVVSAEEDLAQVIADVQDMGMRVTLLQITGEGSPAVSRALRQECDDIVEISAAHLRPYVELISGAEPPRPDESDGTLHALRPALNGNGHAPAPGQNAYPQPQAVPARWPAAGRSAACHGRSAACPGRRVPAARRAAAARAGSGRPGGRHAAGAHGRRRGGGLLVAAAGLQRQRGLPHLGRLRHDRLRFRTRITGPRPSTRRSPTARRRPFLPCLQCRRRRRRQPPACARTCTRRPSSSRCRRNTCRQSASRRLAGRRTPWTRRHTPRVPPGSSTSGTACCGSRARWTPTTGSRPVAFPRLGPCGGCPSRRTVGLSRAAHCAEPSRRPRRCPAGSRAASRSPRCSRWTRTAPGTRVPAAPPLAGRARPSPVRPAGPRVSARPPASAGTRDRASRAAGAPPPRSPHLARPDPDSSRRP